MLGVFIGWPLLTLAPAAVFAVLFVRGGGRVSLVTANVWLLYGAYEMAMKLRILCTGECNIRVDLLLIYPVLLALSVWSVVSAVRARRREFSSGGSSPQ